MSWEKLTLAHLRGIARHYNKDVKIMAIAKMKKNDLITELKKHLNIDYDGGKIRIQHNTGKKPYIFSIVEEEVEVEVKPKKKLEKKEEKKEDRKEKPRDEKEKTKKETKKQKITPQEEKELQTLLSTKVKMLAVAMKGGLSFSPELYKKEVESHNWSDEKEKRYELLLKQSGHDRMYYLKKNDKDKL